VATDPRPGAGAPVAAAPVGTPDPDAALVRRTRLRLIAWSGGLTLLILVLLGGTIYTPSRASRQRHGHRRAT
jgi:hypothetical protein